MPPVPAPAVLTSALFLAHLAATLVMTGVIWFVQVVHYPLFAAAADDGRAARWPAYAAAHATRTTWVVAAPMLVELATGVALLRWRPAWCDARTAWLGLALLAAIWTSTMARQVPRHDALRRAWDARAHRALVRGNWVRTATWTARTALLLGALARGLAA